MTGRIAFLTALLLVALLGPDRIDRAGGAVREAARHLMVAEARTAP